MNERLPISQSLPIKARFYNYPHFTYPWHFHPEYEIIYIKESTGIRFIGNNMATFGPGDIVLVGSNLPHYLQSDAIYHTGNSSGRVTGTIIQFEKEFMHYSIHHYPHFIKIKRLLDEAGNGIYFPSKGAIKLKALLEMVPLKKGMDQIVGLLQLLDEMSSNRFAQIISAGEPAGVIIGNTSRIDSVLGYLNNTYTQNIDLKSVASFAAMNVSAFCRFFKQKTGKSFKNYLQDLRIAYACKLLLMDYKTIYQVSVESGFETVSHFNKVFKKIIGFTPTEYRNNII